MSTFNLTIHCDNDAFVDYPQAEIARILQDLVRTLLSTDDRRGLLHDFNGNAVGNWNVEG